MNKIIITQIKSIKTSNPTLNELQYYIIEKGFSNKKYELLTKCFFDDIKEMKTRQTQIKRIYNNYDTYMYMVHHLNYGIIEYVEFVFNADIYDHRSKLMYLLIRHKIIEINKSKSNPVFRFINTKVIKQLRNQFMWHDEDNYNLCDRAIILNLKAIHFLKIISKQQVIPIDDREKYLEMNICPDCKSSNTTGGINAFACRDCGSRYIYGDKVDNRV